MWGLATSPWVDRRLAKIIDRALDRYTAIDVQDYASLMQLAGSYRLIELHINEKDWLANRTLAEAKLRDEGVVVLGVHRKNGVYLGVPDGTTIMQPKDRLIVYGRVHVLAALDQRRDGYEGDAEHHQATVEHKHVQHQEKAADSDEGKSN
ncbi:MAG: potassium transporter TrkA [Chloroflexi bacterium AL-W]|nr:potassium transporter TrkA [Chloroflexi bacterium AL-N1]NOK68114.1 potassium transporter TrkA [Chloroflexi bacterium AL-N10]NOK73454.1 potassium transporter TrkA [Chloroflexi bacterium AL-N5]NOK83368.1 potassium transporter TrkA [Chloroflexi bacterium AL-W]NOK87785.1 potassium transporter TrkA [Chloroflexi bacterium AL-N15]